jgi:hypothetical protein
MTLSIVLAIRPTLLCIIASSRSASSAVMAPFQVVRRECLAPGPKSRWAKRSTSRRSVVSATSRTPSLKDESGFVYGFIGSADRQLKMLPNWLEQSTVLNLKRA